MLAKQVDFGLTAHEPVLGLVRDWPQPTPLDTDMHQDFEVGLVLAGRQEMHFEGHVFTVGPGEVTLSAAWEPHGWRCMEKESRSVVIHFLAEFLQGEMVTEDRSWLGLYAIPPEDRPRIDAPEARDQVLAIGRELVREIEEKPFAWQTVLRLSIMRLLVLLSRASSIPGRSARTTSARLSDLARIMPALKLVHSGRSRRVRLAEAAAECGLSPSRLGVLFRHTMGLSFGRFELRTRLAHAARSLLHTDLPAEAIAGQSGFRDASHFYHAFRQRYAKTPMQYRDEGRQLP